ncbi:RNA-binding protein, putative [Bodo saltans]|uniref:RNA-binding protein, putative n=1 Tax=Bodo saltans TaxID=75058 RepID=A0A0S4J8G6_BODSA|nr:RNA-binding protein, putative [Bodo saltans]|eukprot:CUG86178.1 RNA-binding protein, putative [Bodo saltans]
MFSPHRSEKKTNNGNSCEETQRTNSLSEINWSWLFSLPKKNEKRKMSRIRILNLPKECTEQMLKSHLTSNLPHSAPAMDITDCSLKRGSDGKIRMGFVGFRTAAAGQFALKHFNASYLRNCKMRVEPATGLNESITTTNLKKKVESGHRTMPAYIQGGSSGEATEGGELYGGKRPRPGNEPATRSGGAQTTATTPDVNEINDDDDEATKRLKLRRKEFVESRMNSGAANVPSWTSEVMLPQGATVGYQENDDEANVLLAPTAAAASSGVLDDEAAMEKQQTLGSMGDLDFLASLGGNIATSATAAAGDDAGLPDNEGDHQDSLDVTAPQPSVDKKPSLTQASSGGAGVSQHQKVVSSSSNKVDEVDLVRTSRRVLVRGIPFIANEDDVKNFFSSKIGSIEAVHIPLTKDTKQSKGAAFVRFVSPEDAVTCMTSLQGAVFMGRLIKVVGVEDDPYAKKAEETAARLTAAANNGAAAVPQSDFKSKRAEDRKTTDASGASWNATFVNTHTAVESVAKRMGIVSSDIVSVEHKGAAVRAAIAEAFLTSEVKAVLGDEGIDLDALNGVAHSALKARSNVTILVKNLSPKVDLGQLSKMFLKFGTLDATAIPTSGAFALYRFLHAQDARVAFQRLAYKPFCGQPLFLEWAPMGSINDSEEEDDKQPATSSGDAAAVDAPAASLAAKTQQLTLYVTNLPFQITDDQFTTFLQDACPRLTTNFTKLIKSVKLDTKGFCHINCADASAFNYLLSKINGRTFEGRKLSCVAAKDSVVDRNAGKPPAAAADDDAFKSAAAVGGRAATLHGVGGGSVPPGCNPLKLIVKNLPFEATEKDLRELFSAFTEIKAVRVPKKVNNFGAHRDNNHRGFGFVEFLTEQEAASALKALTSTHLYGRHLVLQYAKMGAE